MTTAACSTASPMTFKQSEATAARATWVFHLVKSADSTDGTGLVPVLTISKAGGAFASPNGGTAITELTNGWYKVVHNTADFDTLGALGCRIAVATADTLNIVHTVEAVNKYDAVAYGLSALTSVSLITGTAQAGAASTITLASGASATDSLYNGGKVKLTGGTGAGQVNRIRGYVGSTKVATVAKAWLTAPDNTTTYEITPDTTQMEDNSLTDVATAASFDTEAQNGLATAAAVAALAVGQHSVVKTLGTLTTNVALSFGMLNAIDCTVTIAGTWGSATGTIQTCENPAAAAPLWTTIASNGTQTSNAVVVVAGPHAAVRVLASGTTGTTSLVVSVLARYAK